jgi:hypothetical protein
MKTVFIVKGKETINPEMEISVNRCINLNPDTHWACVVESEATLEVIVNDSNEVTQLNLLNYPDEAVTTRINNYDTRLIVPYHQFIDLTDKIEGY